MSSLLSNIRTWKNYLNNYSLQLCMTKISFSAVKGNTEITISFSVIHLNLSNFFGLICRNNLCSTPKKRFILHLF